MTVYEEEEEEEEERARESARKELFGASVWNRDLFQNNASLVFDGLEPLSPSLLSLPLLFSSSSLPILSFSASSSSLPLLCSSHSYSSPVCLCASTRSLFLFILLLFSAGCFSEEDTGHKRDAKLEPFRPG